MGVEAPSTRIPIQPTVVATMPAVSVFPQMTLAARHNLVTQTAAKVHLTPIATAQNAGRTLSGADAFLILELVAIRSHAARMDAPGPMIMAATSLVARGTLTAVPVSQLARHAARLRVATQAVVADP